MDKIKALLEKSGVKSELASEICEAFEQFRATVKEQLDAEYKAKLEEAKKICIDETEAHKRELARRVAIFCETKGAAIESNIAKQSALKESEATSRLTKIVSLLEGIEPNGQANGLSQADITKIKSKIRAVSEERDRAVATANRSNAIAERVTKRNRLLESKLSRLENGIIGESRQPARPQRANQRLDAQRRSGRPVTTRATLVENQDRRPPMPRRTPQTVSTGTEFSVDAIAADMDDI